MRREVKFKGLGGGCANSQGLGSKGLCRLRKQVQVHLAVVWEAGGVRRGLRVWAVAVQMFRVWAKVVEAGL